MADAKSEPQSLLGTQTAESGTAKQPRQEKPLPLRLNAVNNSDQPILANVCNVHLAPGMAYIDFGFVEPGVLAALPRIAQQGGKMPDQVDGKLAVPVVMSFDVLANLQQHVTRAMDELVKAAKTQTTANNALRSL